MPKPVLTGREFCPQGWFMHILSEKRITFGQSYIPPLKVFRVKKTTVDCLQGGKPIKIWKDLVQAMLSNISFSLLFYGIYM